MRYKVKASKCQHIIKDEKKMKLRKSSKKKESLNLKAPECLVLLKDNGTESDFKNFFVLQ